MSETSWILTISIIVVALVVAVVSSVLAYKTAKKQATDKIKLNNKATKSLTFSE